MTGKEKAAYLSRYKKLERHLDQKVEELARWRSRAEKVTPPLLGAGDRQTGDRVAFAVEKIIDIEEEIAADMAQISGVREGIRAAIAAVDDDVLQTLLYYRYIDGCTWEQIAARMSYNYRWVLRLHDRALEQVATPGHIDRC
ncbi:hypothetical protein H8K20_08215 [Neobittarella massiliensis]|uniref:DUF1492 domain-containing protein n=1 Tax=Neobittarella massiliensis (ex Bilen et al. 2018) TaxID=2041842 RepID=A0A8J6LU79_9FIRM|nr:hypothetical protein [Neobittarella massiliensis]MBC3516379.1 hypothetical protein [Neobittarella massiliensis]